MTTEDARTRTGPVTVSLMVISPPAARTEPCTGPSTITRPPAPPHHPPPPRPVRFKPPPVTTTSSATVPPTYTLPPAQTRSPVRLPEITISAPAAYRFPEMVSAGRTLTLLPTRKSAARSVEGRKRKSARGTTTRQSLQSSDELAVASDEKDRANRKASGAWLLVTYHSLWIVPYGRATPAWLGKRCRGSEGRFRPPSLRKFP